MALLQGTDFDEEEADRMRRIELLKCVEEWDHVLAKSQSSSDSTHASTMTRPTRTSVASSDNSDNKSSKPAFNKTSDSQKKHCDEPYKVVQSDHISQKIILWI